MADWEHRAKLASSRLMFKYKYNPDLIEMDRPMTRLHEGPVFKQDQPTIVGFLRSPSYVQVGMEQSFTWNSLYRL